MNFEGKKEGRRKEGRKRSRKGRDKGKGINEGSTVKGRRKDLCALSLVRVRRQDWPDLGSTAI